MRTRTWGLLMALACALVFVACKGQGEMDPHDSSKVMEGSSEARSERNEVTSSREEPENSTERASEQNEQEIFYAPFMPDDAGDLERHVEHGFRGYEECLGDAFADEGQWNGYIIYWWGMEDLSETTPHWDGSDMVAWMEELGLIVVKDYPYCAYYVGINGAPPGYRDDQLSCYANCVVAAPESKMAELFGKGSAAVHGFWLRILPALDPSIPWPEFYDPDKTYYYRGKEVFSRKTE